MFSLGLFVFAVVYFAFGMIHTTQLLWLLFPIYGVYIAATDGVSKAYIAEFIRPDQSGTYFGAYYTITAIGTFLASFIGGLFWKTISPSATFLFGSIMAVIALSIFVVYHRRRYLNI